MTDDGIHRFTAEPHPGIVDFISAKFDVLLGENGDVTLANVLWNGYSATPDKFAVLVMSILTSIELTIQYGAEQAGIPDTSHVEAGFIVKRMEDGELVDVDGGTAFVMAMRCITTFINNDNATLSALVQTAIEKGPQFGHELVTCLMSTMRAMILAATDPTSSYDDDPTPA